MIQIQQPDTPQQWEAYYALRFAVLRQPWGQPQGSEVLPDEASAEHALAIDTETQAVVGVARLQANSPQQGQVRCVAVSSQAQGKGVGKLLMQFLEEKAWQLGMTEIILDARDNAVQFYQSIGYTIIAESYLLFGEIQHYKMLKKKP